MIILPSAVESIKYFLLNLSWSAQKKESDSVVLAKIIIRESHVRDYCPCLPTKVSWLSIELKLSWLSWKPGRDL